MGYLGHQDSYGAVTLISTYIALYYCTCTYHTYVAGFVGTGGLGDWGLRTSEAATTAGLHKISAKSLIVCTYIYLDYHNSCQT